MAMYEVLELASDGWRRDGEPWTPSRPFYAVLGDPIAHSLSPLLQNAALLEREIEAHYHPVRIRTGQLRGLKGGPAGRHLLGFNVTAPHKETVAALCDGRTDQARDLGAVNTVKVEDGKWLGHNTDSGGILTVVSQLWGDEELPARAIVLGAGGSGRAAIDALLRWGVPQLEVRNRSVRGQDAVTRWLDQRESATEVRVTGLSGDAGDPPPESTLWICCLAGGVSCTPYLPVAAGTSRAVLLDLRYGNQRPAEEPPLGFEFHDGLPVLLMQGGLSFAWWCGPPVPWSVMRDALA
jgi:shikimate dehydrogenase